MAASSSPIAAQAAPRRRSAAAKINPFVIQPTVQQTGSTVQPPAGVRNAVASIPTPAPPESNRLSRLPTFAAPTAISPIQPPAAVQFHTPPAAPIRDNPMAAPAATVDGWESADPTKPTPLSRAMSQTGAVPTGPRKAEQPPVLQIIDPSISMAPTHDADLPSDRSNDSTQISGGQLHDNALSFSFGDQPFADEPFADESFGQSLTAGDPAEPTIAESAADDGVTFRLDDDALTPGGLSKDASDPSGISGTTASLAEVTPPLGLPVAPIMIDSGAAGGLELKTESVANIDAQGVAQSDANGDVRSNGQFNGQPDPSSINVDFEKLLRRYRYRPPVEVDTVTLPFVGLTGGSETGIEMAEDFTASIDSATDPATGAEMPITEASAEPIAAPPAKLKLPEGTRFVPLQINLASVRSLTLGGTLQDLHVMDDSVCQAVATAPNQVKLIGTGNGVTQLVLWAESENESGQTRRQLRAFEIRVDDHTAAAAADDSLDMLGRSIGTTFPTADVSLAHNGDRLHVTGHCRTESDAKKILRMVRRTCLMPVVDDLTVR